MFNGMQQARPAQAEAHLGQEVRAAAKGRLRANLQDD
jgi:hypothetical protein